MLDQYLKHAFVIVAIFSAVPLLLSSALGFVVALVQAATQIQEQTTIFLIKVSGLSLLIVFLGQRALDIMVEHLQSVLNSIALLGRMS